MPSINGRELQHALVNLQATCAATGAPNFTFKFFKDLSYKNAAKKEAVRNKQGQQVSYVIKPEETDSTMTTLLSEWFRFRDWLRQQAAIIAGQLQAPVGIGQVEFELTVTYGQVISALRTDRLVTAMVQEESRKSSDNQDPLATEIPLFVLTISDDQNNHFIEYQQ
jgi:hypothetical protein